MSDKSSRELTSEERKLLDEISAAAMTVPEAERAKLVEEKCGGNHRIEREILALLAMVADTKQSDFLAQPAEIPDDISTSASPNSDASVLFSDTASFNHPTEIGNYHIEAVVGEGGFGTVYRAEQVAPVRRTVALKLIKAGMDTRQVIARFESERQALAMMDHACVAKVFDAGTTEQGRPFFVMEFVDGVPIHQFCDDHRLSLQERLRLFVDVCEAIQHAHQKGIIHRDIKPSNVLVIEQDGRHIPKVIDFGIAKATDQRLTEQSMVTEMGQFIGTPAYMSPEQADTTTTDIDTRSDVYSLGVLLYELLTGLPPFDQKRLRSAAYHEIQRIIREEDPPRPSTRISGEGDVTRVISDLRKLEPSRLIKTIRGDLDWIVMKAMEKDRGRRYDSASGFARDIERYLNDEPVLASPPNSTYRIKKLIRRNRGAVAAAAGIAMTLLLGIGGTTYGMLSANEQRDRANAAALSAERKAQTAERISEFVVGLFEASDPDSAKGESISALELLDIGAAKIQALDNEPVVKAELQEAIGWVMLVLGRLQESKPLLERALEYRRSQPTGGAELAQCLNMVANLYDQGGDYQQAEAVAQEATDIREKLFGASVELATSLNTLGNVYWHQDRLEEASVIHRRALKMRESLLPPMHQDIAQSLHNLGALRYFANDLAEAESMYKRAIEIEHATEGENSHGLATSMHVLAIVYQDQGKLAEAIELENQSLAIKERVLGEEHPYIALGLTTLGNIYRLSHRPELAEPRIRKAVQLAEAAWGKHHGEVWWMRRSWAKTLIDLHRTQDAMAELNDLIATIEAAGREDSLPSNLNTLAQVHLDAGRLDRAEELFRRSLGITSHEMERGEAGSIGALCGLARTLHRRDSQEEAAEYYLRAIAALKEERESNDLELMRVKCEFARVIVENGEKEAVADSIADLLQQQISIVDESGARPHELYAVGDVLFENQIFDFEGADLQINALQGAVEKTERQNPVYLAALARAFHESGRSNDAIDTIKDAIALVESGTPRSESWRQTLKKYRRIEE